MNNEKLDFFRKFILFFIFIIIYVRGYSGLIINCEGLTYEETLSFISSNSNLSLEGVIIGSPFKGYDYKKKDAVNYDYFDTGTKFQRGSLETASGTTASFTNLVHVLKEKKIALYSKINLFVQKDGFKRDFWNSTDFTSDSYLYSDLYYLNIDNNSARAKLQSIIQFMLSLSIDKWLVDLRDLPGSLGKDYGVFLRGNYGDKFLVLSDNMNENETRISADDYYFLRNNIFILPVPQLTKVNSFRAHSGWIHYIDSESLSMNNYAAAAYLLSQKQRVVIPYAMINTLGSRIFQFFLPAADFKVKTISDEKLVIYNKDKLAALNFNDNFSFWETENLLNKKGFFKSVFGSSTLYLKANKMRFFMFPESIALWDTGISSGE